MHLIYRVVMERLQMDAFINSKAINLTKLMINVGTERRNPVGAECHSFGIFVVQL